MDRNNIINNQTKVNEAPSKGSNLYNFIDGNNNNNPPKINNKTKDRKSDRDFGQEHFYNEIFQRIPSSFDDETSIPSSANGIAVESKYKLNIGVGLVPDSSESSSTHSSIGPSLPQPPQCTHKVNSNIVSQNIPQISNQQYTGSFSSGQSFDKSNAFNSSMSDNNTNSLLPNSIIQHGQSFKLGQSDLQLQTNNVINNMSQQKQYNTIAASFPPPQQQGYVMCSQSNIMGSNSGQQQSVALNINNMRGSMKNSHQMAGITDITMIPNGGAPTPPSVDQLNIVAQQQRQNNNSQVFGQVYQQMDQQIKLVAGNFSPNSSVEGDTMDINNYYQKMQQQQYQMQLQQLRQMQSKQQNCQPDIQQNINRNSSYNMFNSANIVVPQRNAYSDSYSSSGSKIYQFPTSDYDFAAYKTIGQMIPQQIPTNLTSNSGFQNQMNQLSFGLQTQTNNTIMNQGCYMNQPQQSQQAAMIINQQPAVTSLNGVSPTTVENFKIALCRDYLRGHCNRTSCKFYHPPPLELILYADIYKQIINTNGGFEVCHDFINSTCSRPACKFLHPHYFFLQLCNASNSGAVATTQNNIGNCSASSFQSATDLSSQSGSSIIESNTIMTPAVTKSQQNLANK